MVYDINNVSLIEGTDMKKVVIKEKFIPVTYETLTRNYSELLK